MKKTLLSLSLALSFGVLAPMAAHAVSLTSSEPVAVSHDVATAPSLSSAALQRLPWTPLVPPANQSVTLGGTRLNEGDVQGSVAAFALPADRGSLEIRLTSVVEDNSVYAPNVLVLDEQMRPAAFYPSSYFPYHQPGVIASDRLEGTMKLTPALGQRQIYLLVYTTRQDLARSTTLIAPAKAYAAGVGNAVPDIPDPVARHSDRGTLKIKISAEQQSGNIMIGQPAAAAPAAVIGSAPAPAAAPAQPAPAAPAPAKPAAPVLDDTETYFNQAIRRAVQAGDIDKALKLLDEAERLGSKTARQTFIGSVKGKG